MKIMYNRNEVKQIKMEKNWHWYTIDVYET